MGQYELKLILLYSFSIDIPYSTSSKWFICVSGWKLLKDYRTNTICP